MTNVPHITIDRLREVLTYDPLTGIFYWAKRTAYCVRVGDVAGTLGQNGYIYIHLDKKRLLAHRLAWAITVGEWPGGCLDHINHDPADNRFGNLRNATSSENARNRKMSIVNRSGHKGVSWRTSEEKWYAFITVSGKAISLGGYRDIEDAAKAYRAAADKYFGAFAFIP